ncbi:MAG: AAA family ATPase [Cyanobacteria bacterium J06633_8]
MIATKIDEFIQLFQEFANSYPNTTQGITHTAAYAQQRQIGYRNFSAIIKASDSGEDVTDSVLLKLLPHNNILNNKQRGAWIHIAPAVKEDIKEWFENEGWMNKNDWKEVSLGILNFIRRCNKNPEELSAACREFTQLADSKGLQTEVITPILNALQPDNFLLITENSRKVINYFANTSYNSKLIYYPAVNTTGYELIEKLSEHMHQSGVPALRDDDLFDMFAHWLVTIKKYKFSNQYSSNNKLKNNNSDFNNIELQTEYTLSECAEETGINEGELESWIRSIHRKKQAIIYGSPGTGKTFIAEKIAKLLISGSDGFSELVQFHPAYTYEDFIQGIRPQSEGEKLTYPLIPGCFIKFCHQAETREGICTFIIDEINRANIPQVFGELMYLLEYRDKKIPLAAGNTFRIPENVRIIGTMNTADRSISQFDYALRRRFSFIELRPNYDILRKIYGDIDFPIDRLIDILQKINQAINDKNYEIGISFFITENLADDIKDIWCMEIEPYLEEYFFNQPDTVDEFRWNKLQL